MSLGENEIAENGGEWIGGMGPAKGRPAIQKMMETSIGKRLARIELSPVHE